MFENSFWPYMVLHITFSMVPFRNEYFNLYSSFSQIVHRPFDLNFVICEKVFTIKILIKAHALINAHPPNFS